MPIIHPILGFITHNSSLTLAGREATTRSYDCRTSSLSHHTFSIPKRRQKHTSFNNFPHSLKRFETPLEHFHRYYKTSLPLKKMFSEK